MDRTARSTGGSQVGDRDRKGPDRHRLATISGFGAAVLAISGCSGIGRSDDGDFVRSDEGALVCVDEDTVNLPESQWKYLPSSECEDRHRSRRGGYAWVYMGRSNPYFPGDSYRYRGQVPTNAVVRSSSGLVSSFSSSIHNSTGGMSSGVSKSSSSGSGFLSKSGIGDGKASSS